MIKIPLKHFYMLRHGKSEANAAGVYSGMVDTPLTGLGKEQAKLARNVINGLTLKPNKVIHSHLSRARDTAKLACQDLNVPFIEEARWAEHFLGDWQLKPHDEIRHFREQGIDPPGGETNLEFTSRISEAMRETLSAHERPIIVCHGGCFRAISENYGLYAKGINNAVLYEFLPVCGEKQFPWDVYYYDPETGQKIREKLYD